MTATESNLGHEPEEWEEPSDRQAVDELSIGHRLGSWKTLVSFGFAALVLGIVIFKGGIAWGAVGHHVRTMNLGLYLGAFLIYYATFPLRGLRWRFLLQNAYRGDLAQEAAVDQMSVRGLTEIIYISWFANCVVPAKLGDLYRAYLAKLWVRISFAKTIGTVMAERLVDILVLGFLLGMTGLIAFHARLGHISVILVLGLGLAVIGIIALLLMKTLSQYIRRMIPARFEHRYIALEEGTLHSFRRIPLLLGITALIWILEGGRLQLVFASLGLHTQTLSTIPFLPMLFFALGTAVLTTVPFTPGGLGLVEAGLLGIMVYLGVPKADATAVVLFDRILSYLSIAILGAIVYLLSKRSHFRHPV